MRPAAADETGAREGGLPARAAVIPPSGLAALVKALRGAGYAVIGPVRRGDAIALEEVDDAAALARGLLAEQERGRYRLRERGDGAFFGYAPSAASWKAFLHPPALSLFRAFRESRGFRIERTDPPSPRLAFLGVRPCELAAIARLDTVLARGAYPDPAYAARRKELLVVAVQCVEPGGTCFCASMGTGPRADRGFDLALTEPLDGGPHELLVEAGSERGAALLPALGGRDAAAADVERARAASAAAAGRMGRTLETRGLAEALAASAESPRWEEAARRCLCCGSCTMVCPTCFCTTTEDRTDVPGREAERRRLWDSCFTLDFSYLHGGSVRRSPASRFRHWMTHKLASWWDQFGESGCVGCGRCVTWCPAGIDLTEEARAFLAPPPGLPGPKE